MCRTDSANYFMATRLEVWHKLASDWKPDCLKILTHEITLNEMEKQLMAILAGKGHGHTRVKMA